jgi:hypothetical protein
MLCGATCEDFSLRRNDKLGGYFVCFDLLCGVTCEDLLRLFAIARVSLRRNDKLGGFVMCILIFFVELLARISPSSK